ncbi:MAG: SRPBCC domain-containing protein [Alphaproteobacteria bacterium]|nr:SRPBCC domain-containing protein [Alphaproteobacteria bacterium]
MKSFRTRTMIHASPDAIWSALTDAADYPRWNPTVTKVEGDIVSGGTIKVFATISPDRAFPVKVSRFEPGRVMEWSSGMPLGLFKGVRTFTITPEGEGVAFEMEEVFSGLLEPLIGRTIPDLQPEFEKFAAALKAEVEG